MKAILCVPPPVSPDHPLLGVASIASVIRQQNFEVGVIDLNISLATSNELTEALWQKEGFDSWCDPEFQENVWPIINEHFTSCLQKTEPPELLGFHVSSASKWIAQRLAEHARRLWPSTTIIAGGPAFFFASDDDEVGTYDFSFIGEAEATLTKWLHDFQKCSSSTSRVILSQNTLACLDDLPFPIFDIFPLDKYIRKGVLPIEVSRGCINRCGYCDDSRMWKMYRRKSPLRIRKDLVAAAAQGAQYITFCDSVLNPSPEYFAEFLHLVGESGLSWDGMAQPKSINMEVALQMKMSGCNHIFLGVESFDEQFLSLLNKRGNSLQQSKEAIQAIAEAGINVSIGIIIGGNPLQNHRAFETDLGVLRELAPFLHSVAINPLCIPVGTPLANKGASLGIKGLGSSLSWKFWHAGGGYYDVEQRLQSCKEAAQMLTEAGVSLGANYKEFSSYFDRQLNEAKQYFGMSPRD